MHSSGGVISSSTSNEGVLEQTLTAEAASELKHSLTLARRIGHAHLTPLHVATVLSSRNCLFRRACLSTTITSTSNNNNYNNNPVQLQCRALKLCFNVALNHLPMSSTPPLHQFYDPSLSNALIAALKRAQAHQRRGSVEQQQPLLAIKVELQSLITSILDDPSVSRVMREAGFSSTCVKNNLEKQHHNTSSSSSSSSSLLIFHCNPSSPCSPTHHHQLPC